MGLYLHCRSLWVDEAFLALNVLSRSYAALTQPLDYNQAAPLGFLFAAKTCVNLLGPWEFSLRLIPLAASVALLPLAYFAARKYFSVSVTLWILCLLVLCRPAIYNAAEFKQYSTDALIAALLLVAAGWANRSATGSGCLGLVAAVAVWFSFPSVFVIAGVYAVLLAAKILKRAWKSAALIAVAGLLPLVSFGAHYLTFASHLHHNAYLADFWQEGFMPYDSARRATLWFLEVAWIDSAYPYGRTQGWAVLACCGLGLILLFRRKPGTALLLCSGTSFALLAAMLHLYPFSDRMLLFAMPALLPILGYGLAWLWMRHITTRVLAALLAAGLLVEPTIRNVSELVRAPIRQEVRPVVAAMRAHTQSGDDVCVLGSTSVSFYYYARLMLPDLHTSNFGQAVEDPQFGDRIKVFAGKRVWVVSAEHTQPRRATQLESLRPFATAGREIYRVQTGVAYAVLYQMESQPAGQKP
jgi:hypothetical protein